MAFNSRDTFTIDLSLFGSLVQDIQPSTLPLGVSPDNSDCFFTAGGVYTRPALSKELPSPVAGLPQVLSVKEFTVPSYPTTFIDSNGDIWQNVPNGATSLITSVAPGVQFTAENFDNKQWYAFYDTELSNAFSTNPFVGVDVPLYYDGTQVYRVTSDAPGAPPTFQNIQTSPIDLVQSAESGSLTVTAVASGGQFTATTPQNLPANAPVPVPATYYSTLVYTCSTSVSSSWVGSQVTITGLLGVNANTANISGTIQAVSGSTFTLAYLTTNLVALSTQSGTAIVAGTYLIRHNNTVTAYVGGSQPALLNPGFWASVQNSDGSDINGPAWGITNITRDTTGLVTVTVDQPLTNLPAGTTMSFNPAPSTFLGTVGTTINSTTVNLVSGSPFNTLWAGQGIYISGAPFIIAAVLNPTTIELATAITLPTGNYPYSVTIADFSAGDIEVYQVLNTTIASPGTFNALVVQTSSANNITTPATALTTEMPASVTVGNTMLVSVLGYTANEIPTSITDSLSNTYNIIAHEIFETGSSTWMSLAVYYSTITTGGGCTITSTISSSNGQSMLAHEISGLVSISSPADGNSISLLGTEFVTTFTTPAVTTTNTLDLVYSVVAGVPSSGLAPGSYGLSSTNTLFTQIGTSVLMGDAIQQVSDVGNYKCSWLSNQKLGRVLGATIGFKIAPTAVATGTTTFTFQSLNTVPVQSSSGGNVFQVWTPEDGLLGNAAQILNVGNDPNNGWYIQWFQLGPDGAIATTNGTPQAQIQSQMAPGIRNGVVFFESIDGAQTAPSIPVTFNVMGGTNLLVVGNISIGPPGTAYRNIAFTPSEGSSYYYLVPAILPSTGGSSAVIVTGTQIGDNVTTQAVIDFSDSQLTASGVGSAIDVEGNDLFEQIVLAPCLGVIEYQQRLAWWGEINNIKNLQGMGFDGGYLPPSGLATVTNASRTVTGTGFLTTWAGSLIFLGGVQYTIASVASSTSLTLVNAYNGTNGTTTFYVVNCAGQHPLGWTVSGDGAGTLIENPAVNSYFGFAYKMSSNFNNMIQQPAFQDYYGGSIITGATPYLFRFKALASGSSMAGNFVADLYSPSQGQIINATVALSTIPNTAYSWIVASFNNVTPNTIPQDTVLRIYLSGTSGAGSVTVDELEIIYANQPVNNTQVRFSYIANPFGYTDNAQSGVLSLDTSESISAAFRQRGYIYFLTDQSLFQSQSNNQTEPAGWSVTQYAQLCGCSGPNAVCTMEDTAAWAGRYGIRIFAGDPSVKKISQVIARTWESINWNAQTAIWIVDDPVQQQMLVGIPTNSATMPSQVLLMSHRLMDNAYNVPDPVHVSVYSGKMIATDLGLKISPWQLSLNCAAMCTRNTPQGLNKVLVVGGNFGNLYTFDVTDYPPLVPNASTWKCTDDDYGQINSYYTTAFFYPHDMEQQPQLKQYRKLFATGSVHLTGVGQIVITPLVDALTNPWNPIPAIPLTITDPGFDFTFYVNATGERMSLMIQPQAVTGTDNAFALTHLVVSGREDRVFPNRGSVFAL